MAKKNLTPAQIQRIIQLLLQEEGGVSQLSGALSGKQLLSGLLSSPESLASLRKSAETSVQPYRQFDPNVSYDPNMLSTDVEQKYASMQPMDENEPDIPSFAQNLFAEAKQAGSNPTKISKLLAGLDANKQKFQQQYRMDEDTWNVLRSELDKDIPAYAKQKLERDKKQYAAFLKKRKEAGITSGETATEDYLAGTTGIRGLSELPTSLEDVAKKAATKAVGKFKGQRSEDVLAREAAKYEKAFLAKAKKEKRKPTDYGVAALLKKNLGGF
jgi:hypothetical protein